MEWPDLVIPISSSEFDKVMDALRQGSLYVPIHWFPWWEHLALGTHGWRPIEIKIIGDGSRTYG